MEIPVVTSIYDLCALFNISRVNCTCQKYKMFCDDGDTYKPTAKPVYKHDPTNNTLLASLLVIISLVGIIANLAVQIVTIKFRKQMHRSNIFIAILSFTDMIFSILTLMFNVPLFWKVEWIYGVAMCKLLRGLELITALLSINIMVVIAIDRFLVLIFHLRIKYSIAKIARISMAIAFFVSIVSTIPYMTAVDVAEGSGRCYEQWSGGRSALLAYQWFIMIAFYIIPVIIISITYGYLMKYIKEQLTTSVVVNTEKMMERRVKENRRIMRVLLSVMVAFIVLTLPNKAIWIYISSRAFVEPKLHTVLIFISLLTYPLHSIVNPFIYSVVDKGFRKNLSKMTVGKIRNLSKTESSMLMAEKRVSSNSTSKLNAV